MASLKDIYRLDIMKTVQNLIGRSSKLKFDIFRTTMNMKDVEKRVLEEYLGDIRTFLDTWEEYADILEDAMKDCTPDEKVAVLDYNDFKPYFYSKSDYASVLPFADGVFRGIDSKKFEDPDDINDFFEYTVNKAFRDRADSTVGLLDDVMEACGGNRNAAEHKDIALFNAVRKQGIFTPRDCKELYKASEATLLQMVKSLNRINTDNGAKLMIAASNNIIEYVTYSITAYVTRIYAIAQYAGPFLRFGMYESVHMESANNVEYTFMHDVSEMTFRDIDHIRDTTKVMLDFLEKIGVTPSLKVYNSGLINHAIYNDALLKNRFYSKLLANELREYIVNKMAGEITTGPDQFASYDVFTTTNKKLSEMVYAKSQALSTTSTPCQEIVHVFRGTEPDDKTVKGYQDLADDLAQCSLVFLTKIAVLTQDINSYRKWDQNSPSAENRSFQFRNNAAALVKTLNDLYKEIALATLRKARDIELQLNVLRNAQDAKVAEELTIKVPGIDKTDVSMNDNLMCGVPDTTRMPVNIDNLYAIPTMEYLTMYDEYVKSLPGMAGDPYYEAGNDTIFNKIKSWLAGLAKRIERFFTNASFTAAVKWVENHSTQLDQMTFTQQMTVKGYANNLSIKHIDNLINKINAFKEDDAKDQASVDNFINGLYNDGETDWGIYFGIPDESTVKDMTPEQIRAAYQNAIIFGGKTALQGTDAEKNTNTKTLETSKAIHDELQIWKNNILNSTKTYESINRTSDQLDTAIDSLKNKITNMKSAAQTTQAATTNNNAGNNPPPMNSGEQQPTVKNEAAETSSTAEGGNTNNQQQQPAKPTTDTVQNQNNQDQVDKQDFSSVLLTKTETAIVNLWGNVYPAIVNAIKEQYKYIQEAYAKGQKQQ